MSEKIRDDITERDNSFYDSERGVVVPRCQTFLCGGRAVAVVRWYARHEERKCAICLARNEDNYTRCQATILPLADAQPQESLDSTRQMM